MRSLVIPAVRALDPHVSPLPENEMADRTQQITPKQLRWKVGDPVAIPKKKGAWWGESQTSLTHLTDTVLPSSIYENLINNLKSQPPFATRDAATSATARMVALLDGRNAAEKLANLAASNDPAMLLLLSHFGHLSRWVKSGHDDKTPFSIDPFPEKGSQWAFDFFLRDMPIRPGRHHWNLAVLCYLHLQTQFPSQYPILRLLDVLLLPISQGIAIPVSTFHSILNHIALASPEHRDVDQEELHYGIFLKNVRRRLRAMQIFIHGMKSQFGYEYAKDEEVYLALYKASCQPYPTISELIRDIDLPLPKHHRDERRMLITHYFNQAVPMTPEFFILELLQFGHLHKWRSFLKRWRWATEAGIVKDEDMWTVFWACLARGRHEYYIRYALRESYYDMMEDGKQLILNRNIGIALAKCLEIVDPEEREFRNQRRAAKSMVEAIL